MINIRQKNYQNFYRYFESVDAKSQSIMSRKENQKEHNPEFKTSDPIIDEKEFSTINNLFHSRIFVNPFQKVEKEKERKERKESKELKDINETNQDKQVNRENIKNVEYSFFQSESQFDNDEKVKNQSINEIENFEREEMKRENRKDFMITTKSGIQDSLNEQDNSNAAIIVPQKIYPKCKNSKSKHYSHICNPPSLKDPVLQI